MQAALRVSIKDHPRQKPQSAPVLAMDFALLQPEMVDALSVICPGLSGFAFQDKANDRRAVVEAALDESAEKAANLWLKNHSTTHSTTLKVTIPSPALSSTAAVDVTFVPENPDAS